MKVFFLFLVTKKILRISLSKGKSLFYGVEGGIRYVTNNL